MKHETAFPTVGARVQRTATAVAETTWAAVAYHELAEIPVKEVDLLEAVDENLQRLEELQARLRFMVREVKYLMKL